MESEQPPKVTETPEQWADRTIDTIFGDGVRVADDTGLRLDIKVQKRCFAELAAVKRKADACELWRAEALAHQNLRMENSVHALQAFNDAQAARLAAGLE